MTREEIQSMAREALENETTFWYVDYWGIVNALTWDGVAPDSLYINFGNVHLTREAAQEHADALRKINTQEATC